MGVAKLLSLLIPLIPDVLDFLSVQLGRAMVRQSPNVPDKTDEQVILETVRLIVDQVDEAHPDWTGEEKRRTAAGGIRHHLQTQHKITLSDSEVNFLVELFVVRKRAAGRR